MAGGAQGLEPKHRRSRGSGGAVSYGIAQIKGQKDEDRYCSNLTHDIISLPEFSSFGVFDGHAGDTASIYCSGSLHNDILSMYNEICDDKMYNKNIDRTSAHITDAILCEAIRLAILKADNFIKKKMDSGTTAASIFLKSNPDGSIRLFCSWVGDSRVVLFKRAEDHLIIEMSEDHKPSLERENIRVTNHTDPIWFGLPLEANPNIFDGTGNEWVVLEEKIKKLAFVRKEYEGAQGNKTASQKIIIEKLMDINISEIDTRQQSFIGFRKHPLHSSEDLNNQQYGTTDSFKNNTSHHSRSEHGSKYSNRRNMKLNVVDCNNKYFLSTFTSKDTTNDEEMKSNSYNEDSRPATLSTVATDGNTRSNHTKSIHSINSASIHSAISKGSNSNKNDNNNNSIHSRKSSKKGSNKDTEKSQYGDIGKSAHSYFSNNTRSAKYQASNSSEPNLAVFGTNGCSLMMTRSIGDRLGPRSCSAVPDITAINIASGEHARVVLATDGLWDVVTNSTAQLVVMSTSDPLRAADKLVSLAFQRRLAWGLRKDDITAIVVDINAQHFVPLSRLSCAANSCNIC